MKQLREIFRLMRRLTPSLPGWIILSCLVTGLTPLPGIIIPRLMLDELTGARSLPRLLILAVILAGGSFAGTAGKALCKKHTALQLTDFTMKMEEWMGEKPSRLPLAVSEKKSTMDLYERGKFGLDGIAGWNETIQAVGSAAITLLSSGAVILSNLWYLLPFLLAAGLLTLPCMSRLKKLEEDNARRSVPENREFGYYCTIAYDFRYAKDLKIFRGIDFMLSRAQENMDRILKINHSYFTKSGALNGLAAAVVELETAVLFAVLGILLAAGSLTVGAFTMLYSACRQFSQSLNSVITNANLLITGAILIEPLLDYLYLERPKATQQKQMPAEESLKEYLEESLSPQVRECLRQAAQGVLEWEFDDVTFHYPSAEANSLSHLHFRIRSGETVALVGKNGAGKTTAVKLLCRFYDQQQGRILLNGVDIRRIPRADYYRLLAPTFQDFQLLPFPIDENILCRLEVSIREEDLHALRETTQGLAFLDWVENLPQGFHTFLSQNLTKDGVLPSGGLAQKIALARSVCHGGGMVIMDEPTSALDPRSEEEVFGQMGRIARDKTCLFISHRLSSTRLADRILVMDEGRIAEEGTHDELIRLGGVYRELYEAQASQYK